MFSLSEGPASGVDPGKEEAGGCPAASRRIRRSWRLAARGVVNLDPVVAPRRRDGLVRRLVRRGVRRRSGRRGARSADGLLAPVVVDVLVRDRVRRGVDAVYA